MTPQRDETGFTLVEMMVASLILLPMLMGLLIAVPSINNTMDANNRSADVANYGRRMSSRLARLVRPAKMSTLRVPAVAADVAALRAANVGEWILPTDLVWRPGVEFRSASGLLSMNASLATSLRRVEFVLDPAETDNDKDDDGDGLIDEGTVRLLQNDVTLAVLEDVEALSFQLDGRMMKMRLTVARQGANHRVFRFTVESEYYMRNN